MKRKQQKKVDTLFDSVFDEGFTRTQREADKKEKRRKSVVDKRARDTGGGSK